MPSKHDIDALDFVMGFVQHSDDWRSQYLDKWTEILANYVVDPYQQGNGSVDYPYEKGRRYGAGRGIILKSNDTHKAIATLASSLMLSLFGDGRREYIKASPVGWEDAPHRAPTANRLLRHAFSRQGVYRSLTEAIFDMLLFGTSIVEIPWIYRVREQPVREVEDVFGVEVSTTRRMPVVQYDDVGINVLDNADFYPDPAHYRLEDMPGAAKRFKVIASAALANGSYDPSSVGDAVEMLGAPGSQQENEPTRNFREGIDQPDDTEGVDDFSEMIGFEYWGEVPWDFSNPDENVPKQTVKEGTSRAVVTVLNKQIVRNRSYPLADSDLPWRAFVINPLQGRFYGVAPAEVMRWDQDLQDASRILLAEAIIRQVHPPIAYDPDNDVADGVLPRLNRWSPDQPIPIRGGPSSIGTVQYGANAFNGFALVNSLAQSMQEGSAALGSLQGLEGPDRESATVGSLRFQSARGRPEMNQLYIEKETLPGIAQSILRRYQQFLPDTAELRKRVGDLPETTWIGDIMGDFDVQFVGSRLIDGRQEQLQMYDRLVSLAAVNPAVAAQIPWDKVMQELIGEVMQLPNVAARIAAPEVVQRNLLLALAQAPGGGGGGVGNGNGEIPRAEPAGLGPAQATGNIIG